MSCSSQNLLDYIRSIKQKYNKYGEFKTLVNQEANNSEEMAQKIRSMTIAFQVIAQQNNEVMRLHSSIIPIIGEKDKQIELKELEVRKYRQQMLDLMNKNQQLTNYSRKLANQYTILLHSIKDNEEVALKRQCSAGSKLKMMENQVSFLRDNILKKNGQENIKLHTNPEVKTSAKKQRCSSSKKLTKSNSKSQYSSLFKSKKSVVNKIY